MARFAYFRNASRGAMASGVSLLSLAAYVREIAGASADSFALRVSWV